MKSFLVFAGMLFLCLKPVASMAQCGPGCGSGPGGGAFVETVAAHASISSVSTSSPVTITAGVHWVELNGLHSEPYSVTYSGYFLLDGTIDTGTASYSPNPCIITTDGNGHWQKNFSLTSSALPASAGSHTANVWSDIFDPNTGTPPSAKSNQDPSLGFVVS